MSKSKIVTIFPSVEFRLKSDQDAVPLFWLIAYLEQIFRAIPKEEQRTAIFTKWKGSMITYEKSLSPVEQVKDGLSGVVADLEPVVAAAKGLTKAEVAALLAQLKAL